jgi:hypothetical protein
MAHQGGGDTVIEVRLAARIEPKHAWRPPFCPHAVLGHNTGITMRDGISASLPAPCRKRYLLSPVAYHRHRRRAVWIDPVVLRAITISWNNIGIPVRPFHGHPDDEPLPVGLPRLGRSKGSQVAQHQGRSESERYGHYPHGLILIARCLGLLAVALACRPWSQANASSPPRQIKQRRPLIVPAARVRHVSSPAALTSVTACQTACSAADAATPVSGEHASSAFSSSAAVMIASRIFRKYSASIREASQSSSPR